MEPFEKATFCFFSLRSTFGLLNRIARFSFAPFIFNQTSSSMKNVLVMALACALGLTPRVRSATQESTPTVRSTYVVTDKMAMYLASDNTLRLRFGQVNENAVVEVLNGPRTLYRNHIDLRKGAHQTLILSELESGSYQIRVRIGKQVTDKMLIINQSVEKSIRLS